MSGHGSVTNTISDHQVIKVEIIEIVLSNIKLDSIDVANTSSYSWYLIVERISLLREHDE